VLAAICTRLDSTFSVRTLTCFESAENKCPKKIPNPLNRIPSPMHQTEIGFGKSGLMVFRSVGAPNRNIPNAANAPPSVDFMYQF